MSGENVTEKGQSPSVGIGSSGSAFLTSDEEERLVMACIATGPKTEQEATRVLEWAHETRLRSEMLTMALEGKLFIGLTADDLTFTTSPNTQVTHGRAQP